MIQLFLRHGLSWLLCLGRGFFQLTERIISVKGLLTKTLDHKTKAI